MVISTGKVFNELTMKPGVKNVRLRVLTISDYSRMLGVGWRAASAYYHHDCEEHRVKIITCSLFAAIYKIDYVPLVSNTAAHRL
jgi:hypothetical protein